MSVSQGSVASTVREQISRAPQWLLWLGIIAPLLFAAVFTLDGALTLGYSAYNEAISYLDLGPFGWVQRLNFILFGVLLLAFTVGYVKYMPPLVTGGWLVAVAALLALSDLGWILAGLFVPSTYLAPQNSGQALAHQFASILVFLPFALALLVQGIRLLLASSWRWRLYGLYCILLGLIQAVFPIGTTVYFFNPGIVGNVNSPGSGQFNRIALGIGPLSWYIILAVVLLVHSRWRKANKAR